MQACKTPDAPEAPAAWCAAASHALPRPTGSRQPTPQASSSPHHSRAVHTTAARATPYGTPRGASLRACESLEPCARSAYHTVASTLPCPCPHFLPPYLRHSHLPLAHPSPSQSPKPAMPSLAARAIAPTQGPVAHLQPAKRSLATPSACSPRWASILRRHRDRSPRHHPEQRTRLRLL